MLAMRRTTWGMPALTQNPTIVAIAQPSASSEIDRGSGWSDAVTTSVVADTTTNAAASIVTRIRSVVSTTAVEARDAAVSCAIAERPALVGGVGAKTVMTSSAARPEARVRPTQTRERLLPMRNWLKPRSR
jgi:hypothetical protein